MSEPSMTRTSGGTIWLFDDRGGLIGTIDRPVQRDPVGPGRETVYVARPDRMTSRPAAAA